MDWLMATALRFAMAQAAEPLLASSPIGPSLQSDRVQFARVLKTRLLRRRTRILSLRISAGVVLFAFAYAEVFGAPQHGWKHYRGRPYDDAVYHGGPQKIPGRIQCAYYDLGGEGVAYHDLDAVNHGSGELNPANGTYFDRFRMNEGVDISYTKFHDQIDNNPYNKVLPPENQLYVGWTEPGEWFNMTVRVTRTGVYRVDLLYTSRQGGQIALDLNGRNLARPIAIVSTADPREPIDWRQVHHWNLMPGIAHVKLQRGLQVLTLRIVTQGHMNLAYLDFGPQN
jgi:hypothetical protein